MYYFFTYLSHRASPSSGLASFSARPTGRWYGRSADCSNMETAVVLPSATGAMTRLNSSMRPSCKKDQFTVPPPATINRSIPKSD